MEQLYLIPPMIAIQVTLTDTPSTSGYRSTSSVLGHEYIELHFITPFTNHAVNIRGFMSVVV